MRKLLWIVMLCLCGCKTTAPVQHTLTIWYEDGPSFASYEIAFPGPFHPIKMTEMNASIFQDTVP